MLPNGKQNFWVYIGRLLRLGGFWAIDVEQSEDVLYLSKNVLYHPSINI